MLDFGVAKRVGGSPGIRTMPDVLIGTLYYMSPEQAQRNREVDHRADLWALGVIAFRCLTGKLPFKSDTLVDTLRQIIIGPIPVPSRIARVTGGSATATVRICSDPWPWFSACMKMMRKHDPHVQEDGFHFLLPHAAEFCEDLLREFHLETADRGRRGFHLEFGSTPGLSRLRLPLP